MTTKINGTNTAANPAITGADTDTGLSFGTDTVNINTGGTTRATVDSSGNLNIPNDSGKIQLGTSSDLQIYHSGSNSFIKQVGTGDLYLQCDNGETIFLRPKANEDGIKIINDGAVELYHNGSKKFETANLQCIVTGLLQAYVNRSDSYYSSNNYSHIIHSDSNGSAVLVIDHSGDSSPYGLYMRFSDYSPNNNTNYFIMCADSGNTNRFIVWSDGDVQNDDNSYGSTSDVKLKENIVDAKSQWDDIKAIRVRNFNFKTDTPSDKRIGVVAQEIETVCPSLVSERPDLDKDNKDLGTTTKSVKYSILYMKAIKALQEAQARIETLEAKVAALEAA